MALFIHVHVSLLSIYGDYHTLHVQSLHVLARSKENLVIPDTVNITTLMRYCLSILSANRCILRQSKLYGNERKRRNSSRFQISHHI